jgi:hypothetical protein
MFMGCNANFKNISVISWRLRFLTLGLYLKLALFRVLLYSGFCFIQDSALYRILVYSWFGSDTFHCTIYCYSIFDWYMSSLNHHIERWEKFEDTKGGMVIRSCRSTDNTMAKIKRTKAQTMIHKTLHSQLKIE